MRVTFATYQPVSIQIQRAHEHEQPPMPRSKFATKAYGPTKPKICEDQQLPPGVLPPGPGQHCTAHFFLDVAGTGGTNQPVTGTAIIVRTPTPNRYEGSARLGEYTVTIRLTAVAPIFQPLVDYWVYRAGQLVNGGHTVNQEPRSINPYDTGIMIIGAPAPWGQQMIRIVARD